MQRERELSATVAQKLFGWRTHQTSNAGKVLWHESQGTWGNPAAQPTSEPVDPVRDGLWDNYIEDYTSDPTAAWMVVEKMRADGFNFTLHAFTPHGYGGGCQVSFVCNRGPCPKHGHTDHTCHGAFDVEAATMPLAVCLAALRAVGVEVQG